MGVATDVPVTFISRGSTDFAVFAYPAFLDMANFILNQSFVPTVFSTSYGSIEVADQAELAMCVCCL